MVLFLLTVPFSCIWICQILGGIASGLIGGVASLIGGNQQNTSASNLMDKQEAYETQMSNTAYQRSTADMKAAGLNPMAMMGSGSAASTPSVQQAPVANALGQGVSSAMSGISLAKDLKSADSDNTLKSAQTIAAAANANAANSTAKQSDAQTKNINAALAGISAKSQSDQSKYNLENDFFKGNLGSRIKQGFNLFNSAKDQLYPQKSIPINGSDKAMSPEETWGNSPNNAANPSNPY